MLEVRVAQANDRMRPVEAPLPGDCVVLIVDDDDDFRETLGDLFTSVGLPSMAFPSTAALLKNGLPDKPSCMVLDLRMPGASGLDLQARLAEMGARVPVIFLTGYADVPTTVRAMKAGALDFLPKPVREQELLDTVTDALRRDHERRCSEDADAEVRRLAQSLTPRETDVLRGVSRGLLNKQIAFELGITEITVKMHRSSAGRKLRSNSVADLIKKVELLGL